MMKVEIENKENNIICKIVALEYSHTECDGRIYITTKRVRKILTEGGHNPGRIIVDSHVDNCNNNLEGVWVFEDLNKKTQTSISLEESTPKATKTNRRKNSRKSKKTLDNSQKDVIIEE